MAVKRTCNMEMSMYRKIQPLFVYINHIIQFLSHAINVFYRCVQCTNDRQCRDSRR